MCQELSKLFIRCPPEATHLIARTMNTEKVAMATVL